MIRLNPCLRASLLAIEMQDKELIRAVSLLESRARWANISDIVFDTKCCPKPILNWLNRIKIRSAKLEESLLKTQEHGGNGETTDYIVTSRSHACIIMIWITHAWTAILEHAHWTLSLSCCQRFMELYPNYGLQISIPASLQPQILTHMLELSLKFWTKDYLEHPGWS